MTRITEICPPPEVLAIYARSGPIDEATRTAGVHLDRCPDCAREVMEMMDRLLDDREEASREAAEEKGEAPALPEGTWARIREAAAERRSEGGATVIRLELGTHPRLFDPEGVPVDVGRRAVGVRAGLEDDTGCTAEIDLEGGVTLMLFLGPDSLRLRASDGSAGIRDLDCSLWTPPAPGSREVARARTDRAGRARLPLPPEHRAGALLLRVEREG